MTVSERMSNAGLVPVVVLENAADAVPTARALLAGGVDVMEITFRTAAAEDSIRAVAQECGEMVVGAGTVVTLEQCRRAVDAGAQFIVSPGYDDEVVAWCVEHDVTIVPGCVTPTEIMAAMKRGLSVLKFFPAGVYGGLSAMKALSAPFGSIRFVPTGGVNEKTAASTAPRRLFMPLAAAGCARRRTLPRTTLKRSRSCARQRGRRSSALRSAMWA